MFGISRSEVNRYKLQFPEGTRVVCNYCSDPYHPVPEGMTGTVRCVDDIGTVHVNWDNGQSLGLVPGEDSFSEIKESK